MLKIRNLLISKLNDIPKTDIALFKADSDVDTNTIQSIVDHIFAQGFNVSHFCAKFKFWLATITMETITNQHPC